MRLLIEAGLPLLIPVAMLAVGLELTPADLLRVLHEPLRMGVVLAGQVIILPLLAVTLIALLHPPPAVAGGLMLTAAAPQALSSNYFCLLARADVALSVALTAVSSILAVAAMPLAAQWMIAVAGEHSSGLALPAGRVAWQVATGLLLPVGAGMALRQFATAFVARHRARVQGASLAFAAIMVALLVADQAAVIRANLGAILLVSVLFTCAAALAGFGLGRVLRWGREGTVALAAAFPSRSLSIATLIALNVLGRRDFLSFATIFFLVQALLLAPAMVLCRPTAHGSTGGR